MVTAFGTAIVGLHVERFALGRAMGLPVDKEIIGNETVVTNKAIALSCKSVEGWSEGTLVEEEATVILIGVLAVGLSVECGYSRQLTLRQRALDELQFRHRGPVSPWLSTIR